MKQQFKVVTEKINLIYNDYKKQLRGQDKIHHLRKAFTFYQDTFRGLNPNYLRRTRASASMYIVSIDVQCFV